MILQITSCQQVHNFNEADILFCEIKLNESDRRGKNKKYKLKKKYIHQIHENS